MNKEYTTLSRYYDPLHNKKDYGAEAKFFMKLIEDYKRSKGKHLVDIACGSGNHLYYFKNQFNVEGIDLSKDLIKIAKEKNPKIKFMVQDMRRLDLKEKFDVITLLFSSIAYLKNEKEVIKTLEKISKSLEVGGVLIVETVYLKDSFKEVKNHVREYLEGSFSIKRVIDIAIRKNIAVLKAKYTLNEGRKKEKIIKDKLEVPLLSKQWLIKILQDFGFRVSTLKYNKTGTTLFICVKK